MNNFFDKIGELFSTPEYIDSLLHGFLLTIQISYFAILIGAENTNSSVCPPA